MIKIVTSLISSTVSKMGSVIISVGGIFVIVHVLSCLFRSSFGSQKLLVNCFHRCFIGETEACKRFF